MIVAAGAVPVLLRADEPFFGAKEICDERMRNGEFGHPGWVSCFKSIANRTLAERVFLAAWPWVLIYSGVVVLVAAAMRNRLRRASARDVG